MRVDITNFFEDFYENLANFRPREGTNCRQYAVILEHKSAIFELEPLYSSENLCQNFLNSRPFVAIIGLETQFSSKKLWVEIWFLDENRPAKLMDANQG